MSSELANIIKTNLSSIFKDSDFNITLFENSGVLDIREDKDSKYNIQALLSDPSVEYDLLSKGETEGGTYTLIFFIPIRLTQYIENSLNSFAKLLTNLTGTTENNNTYVLKCTKPELESVNPETLRALSNSDNRYHFETEEYGQYTLTINYLLSSISGFMMNDNTQYYLVEEDGDETEIISSNTKVILTENTQPLQFIYNTSEDFTAKTLTTARSMTYSFTLSIPNNEDNVFTRLINYVRLYGCTNDEPLFLKVVNDYGENKFLIIITNLILTSQQGDLMTLSIDLTRSI